MSDEQPDHIAITKVRLTSLGGLASSIAFGRLGGSLDVRGEGTSVGTSFAGLSESLGWLKSDSHQDRLRRLREKYGYDQ